MLQSTEDKIIQALRGKFIYLMGFVVLTVFMLAVLWEFVVEEWLIVNFLGLARFEGAEEKWEYVATTIFFVCVALVIPTLMAFRYIKQCERSEGKLIESQSLYRNIVENINEIIFRLDEDGKITFANTAFKFLGYDPEDLIGKPIEDFVVSDEKDKIMHGLLTKYVGPLASGDLVVQLRTNGDSTVSEHIETQQFIVDSMGIWNVSDEEVYKKDVEKKFLGTLNIGRIAT